VNEKKLVDRVVSELERRGFSVVTEVANLYRSADIAAVSSEGELWIVECKVSNMARAVEQSRTHKHAADRVYVATYHRKSKVSTVRRIRDAGLGLIYVMPDGTVEFEIDAPRDRGPWKPARDRLLERIQRAC
jgi:hypothetical protein